MNDQPTNPRNTDIPALSRWQLGLPRRQEGLSALSSPTEHPSHETPARDSDPPVHVQLVYVSPEERAAAVAAKAAPPPPAQSETCKPSPKKKRVRRKPARKSPLLTPREVHEAHCSICGTPYREEIEEEFVSWHNVSAIARYWQIERRNIYRHAHAFGLFAARDRNIRMALGHIIEEAENIHPSADSVIRAVRMLTHINEDGEWVQPPAHVIVSSGTALQAPRNLPQASK